MEIAGAGAGADSDEAGAGLKRAGEGEEAEGARGPGGQHRGQPPVARAQYFG